MQINFVKMQGLGNDYIIINDLDEQITDYSGCAIKLCQHHFGIGADGIIFLQKSDAANFKMRIFTPDGNETEMSGNGMRCLARYLYDSGLVKSNKMELETLAGIKRPEIVGDLVKVRMGEPIINRSKIPMKGPDGPAINVPLNLKDSVVNVSVVSMGNPHAIVFVETFNFSIENLGKQIETHPLFPHRANVGFAQVISRKEINLCTWERGAGITLACGTGASAAVVAGVLSNLVDRRVTVRLLGGELFIEWSETDNNVYMTGPAKKVFEGSYEWEEETELD